MVGRYEYDGLGRRAKSHVDSQSPASPDGIDAYLHCFYNQGWQEVESRRSTSENTGPESLQPQYQYVWSRRYIDAPVLRDKNTDTDRLCDDERLYYLGDANFNVTTLVNTGGDAVERYVYSPYGVLTIYDATWSNIRSASSYANVDTYTGRQLDTETGLFYYRARFLHAQLGRFTRRDTFASLASGSNMYEWKPGEPITSNDDARDACLYHATHGPETDTTELPPYDLTTEDKCQYRLDLASQDRDVRRIIGLFGPPNLPNCSMPLVCCNCCRWAGLYRDDLHAIMICLNNVDDQAEFNTYVIHELHHALQACQPGNKGRCEQALMDEMEAYRCANQCTDFSSCLRRALESRCGSKPPWCTVTDFESDPGLYDRLKRWYEANELWTFCYRTKSPGDVTKSLRTAIVTRCERIGDHLHTRE